jgi:hypothetical protein
VGRLLRLGAFGLLIGVVLMVTGAAGSRPALAWIGLGVTFTACCAIVFIAVWGWRHRTQSPP